MTREEIVKDGFVEEEKIDACLEWIERAKSFHPNLSEHELYQLYKEMLFQNS